MKKIGLFIYVAIVFNMDNVKGFDYSDVCTGDADCTEGLYCVNKQCNCKSGYQYNGEIAGENGNKAECALILGTKCSSDEECSNLNNSKCLNEKCVCESNLYPSSDSEFCLGDVHGDELCQLHKQCIKYFGENSECLNNKCVCRPAFHNYDNNELCIPTSGFQQKCETNEQCYELRNNENVLTCKNKVCNCKEGLIIKGGKCISSANKSLMTLTTMIFSICALLRI